MTAAGDGQLWLQSLGMAVRLYRVRFGWTQAELGERAGVSRVTVGSVERGDHPASVLAFRRIGAALGVPLAELVEAGPPDPVRAIAAAEAFMTGRDLRDPDD